MKKRFVYVYFMKRAQPDKIRETVPHHVDYWKSRELDGYMGGPFADRSDGLISFEASSIETATALADADPFVVSSLIDSQWIKEWLVE